MKDKNRVLYLSISIIIGIICIILTILGMIFYPENFSFLSDDFSIFGRLRTEGNLPNTISFSLSLILSWLSGTFFLYFWIKFRKKFDDNSKYVALTGSILGIISSISLIVLGMLPVDIFSLPHGIFAVLYFVFGALAFLFYSISIIRNPNFNNFEGYLSLIYTILAFFYLAIYYFPFSPLIQKICVYYFILWIELENRQIII